MANYDASNTRYVGSIDIEVDTVIPQFTLRNGSTTNGYFRMDKGEAFSFQLLSDDVSSDDVTWTLQYSLDETNWITAVDSSGIDIDGVIVKDTATVQSIYAPRYVYFRISLTVAAQTGTVDYIIRPADSEK